ncbi:MAG: phosphatidate cytidylyltransferase [Bacteroidales bacterium]|nr:phosphatidate cytidylyltransferase [Bacteroidales bacterium]
MNNTVVRTISGLVFLALMISGLLLSKFYFAALFIFIMIVMMVEFYGMTMGDKYHWPRRFGIITAVITFIVAFLHYAYMVPTSWIGLIAVPLIGTMIYTIFAKEKEDLNILSNLFTGFIYIGIPMVMSNFVVFDKEGNFDGMLMLCFFMIIWASDVGAYCFGMLFGRNGRKLAPSISPKKSWAGAYGGFFTAILMAVIMYFTGLLKLPLWHLVALAAVMNVAAVFGDLFESQWKRFYGVKDSGKIIPGHGGMLDRFDSALFAIPIGVVYLIIFSLI